MTDRTDTEQDKPKCLYSNLIFFLLMIQLAMSYNDRRHNFVCLTMLFNSLQIMLHNI